MRARLNLAREEEEAQLIDTVATLRVPGLERGGEAWLLDVQQEFGLESRSDERGGARHLEGPIDLDTQRAHLRGGTGTGEYR